MVLAGITDTSYEVVLFLHIIAVLIAFAPAVVNPLLFGRMEGDSSMGRLAGIAADNGRKVHFPALIAVGVLGIVLVLLSDEAWEFGDVWVSLALLGWIAICGIVSGMILPNERKVADGDQAAVAKVELGGKISTLLLVAVIFLMVFKPGA